MTAHRGGASGDEKAAVQAPPVADTPSDLLGLLPTGLPESSTTADIIATGRSRRLAMRAAYCHEGVGSIAKRVTIGNV